MVTRFVALSVKTEIQHERAVFGENMGRPVATVCFHDLRDLGVFRYHFALILFEYPLGKFANLKSMVVRKRRAPEQTAIPGRPLPWKSLRPFSEEA